MSSIEDIANSQSNNNTFTIAHPIALTILIFIIFIIVGWIAIINRSKK